MSKLFLRFIAVFARPCSTLAFRVNFYVSNDLKSLTLADGL